MILFYPKFDKANFILPHLGRIAGFVKYIAQIDQVVFPAFIQSASIRGAIAFMADIKYLKIFRQRASRYLIPSFENPPFHQVSIAFYRITLFTCPDSVMHLH